MFIQSKRKSICFTFHEKKDGQRHALPPQIFNGEEYRGVSTLQEIINDLHLALSIKALKKMARSVFRSFANIGIIQFLKFEINLEIIDR